jgi:hypothetical protein
LRLGEDVPGILTDKWKFVEDDPYADKVKLHDRDAALVCHVETRQFGVARFIKEEFCPGGAWLVAFRARDPETGDPITGRPDGRILDAMRRFDTWGQANPSRMRDLAKVALERREEQISEQQRERNYENALKFIYDYKRASGTKDKIIVPAGAGGVE